MIYADCNSFWFWGLMLQSTGVGLGWFWVAMLSFEVEALNVDVFGLWVWVEQVCPGLSLAPYVPKPRTFNLKP